MTAAAALPADLSWREEFAERGHCVLRGALPATAIEAVAGAFRDYISGLHTDLDCRERSQAMSATRMLASLATAPAAIRDFVRSTDLGQIAAQALDVPAVRVLHFNGFYKPVGGMVTPWHQDMNFIPLACRTSVTLWLPMAPLAPDMAPLMFADGSQRDGAIDLRSVEARYPIAANPPMRPGDVSVHCGWVAHRSAPNRSDRPREAIAISYFPEGTRLRPRAGGPPMMASMLADLFPGLRPGDLAQGPTVPLVYPADSHRPPQWDDPS